MFTTILYTGLIGRAACLQKLGSPVESDLLPAARSHSTIRVADPEDSSRSFEQYQSKHGKNYNEESGEVSRRLELFNQRQQEVEQHNLNPNRRWTAGMNAFSDRTPEEMAAFRGYRHMFTRKHKKQDDDENTVHIGGLDTYQTQINDDLATIPEEKDWSTWSSLLYIRDQGACGSCWAVSATTILAAHSEIHGTNRTFSTQQVVDCVPNPNVCGGSGGCGGATVELAFQYVMDVGLQDPAGYGGYTARDGQCSWTPTESTTPSLSSLTELGSEAKIYAARQQAPGLDFGMTGWQKLDSNKEQPLLMALANQGPVAIALAANDIMMYESGVFDGCSDWVLNHAVSLVGYGKDQGDNYWLVQNSWGQSWGEGGRIRIIRSNDEDGNCGMDSDPQAGLACKGETEPVKVCGTCGILYDSVIPLFSKL